MDKDRQLEIAKECGFSFSFCENYLLTRLDGLHVDEFTQIVAAIEAEVIAGMEPVYQRFEQNDYGEYWEDISRGMYDLENPDYKRILYRLPDSKT